MPNYAIRVTLPFQDCSGSILSWFNRCKSGVVYQHESDEEIRQTHIHLVLFECEVEDEQLKRIFRLLCHLPGKGNGFWSFKTTYKKDKVEVPVDEGAITYASKGCLRPVYAKLFSQDRLEHLRQLWVEKVDSDKPSESSAVKYYVDKVYAHFDNVVSMYDIPKGDEDKWGDRKSQYEVLFDMVRKRVFRVMYHQKGIAPHPPQYKMVTSTVFSKIGERLELEDEFTEVLIKYWY